MAETYTEEKASPVGRFRRGDHLSEGEIVAIVIIIITDIIEIIINIIPNISTCWKYALEAIIKCYYIYFHVHN